MMKLRKSHMQNMFEAMLARSGWPYNMEAIYLNGEFYMYINPSTQEAWELEKTMHGVFDVKRQGEY